MDSADSLLHKMIQVAQDRLIKCKHTFVVGQRVRVRKGVSSDGQTSAYWDGSEALVKSFHWRGDCFRLELIHPNGSIDHFKDDELDRRFFKRAQ